MGVLAFYSHDSPGVQGRITKWIISSVLPKNRQEKRHNFSLFFSFFYLSLIRTKT
jgi:hypothetical protein